jgi:hypothetical protein
VTPSGVLKNYTKKGNPKPPKIHFEKTQVSKQKGNMKKQVLNNNRINAYKV